MASPTDWIKMRTCLPEEPEVLGISERTGIDPFGVVGRLLRLWAWATDYTTDGNAPSVTLSRVDKMVDCPGFGKAMLEMGWLLEFGGGISFPKFDKHMSQGAKTRALTSKRVGEFKRKKSNAEGNDDGNGGSVNHSPSPSNSTLPMGGAGGKISEFPHADIQRISDAFPIRSGVRAGHFAIKGALHALFMESHPDPVGRLMESCEAYRKALAKNPGLAAKPWQAKSFFEGHFDDDPATWADRKKPDSEGEPSNNGYHVLYNPPQPSHEVIMQIEADAENMETLADIKKRLGKKC